MQPGPIRTAEVHREYAEAFLNIQRDHVGADDALFSLPASRRVILGIYRAFDLGPVHLLHPHDPPDADIARILLPQTDLNHLLAQP